MKYDTNSHAIQQEDRELALQRERLKNRNIPGGEDSVGDDPLAESTEAQQSTELPVGPADTAFLSPGDSFKPSSARGVTLELGMGAKELDLLLSELEVRHTVMSTGTARAVVAVYSRDKTVRPYVTL